MKKLVFSLLMIAPVLLYAQFNGDKDPFIVKSLSSESLQKVLVETSGGAISVTGVSASEARIEVYIRPNNGKNESMSKDEIQKRLDENYTLEVSVANNQLTAIAKQRKDFNNWKRSLSISFRIYVPESINTKLRTSGGSIAIKNLSGMQDFSTSGGSLSVEKISGQVNGRTSGGSISVIDSKDDIDLSTSGGSIEAKNCNGNLELSTSGGSLSFHNLKGKIEAKTSGGSIGGEDIEGELYAHTSGGSIDLSNLSCSLETSTSGGNIEVDIKELGKFVRIDNSGGNVSLSIPKGKGVDLDLRANKIKVDALTNFSGSKEDDSMSGTLNGGGTTVKVRAGSGRISLTTK